MVKVWDVLQVTHKDKDQVKESKINLLTYQYELFKIEGDETIEDMVFRLVYYE